MAFTATPGTINSTLGGIEPGLGALSLSSTTAAIISQIGTLVITQGTPAARISQVGIFVIVPKITSGGVILVGMNGLKKLSEFTGGMN